MMGLAVGCLGSHVQAPVPAMVPVPPILTGVQASTTPTVMVTAELALLRAFACGPGSRVLVHAGTGGVGLAAVQVRSLNAHTTQMIQGLLQLLHIIIQFPIYRHAGLSAKQFLV